MITGEKILKVYRLKKINEKKNMTAAIPVFFSSNDVYTPILCTAIYSLLNHTQASIALYILDGGISQKSKVKISESLQCFSNFIIEYIDMSSTILNHVPCIAGYSINIFSRYFIAELKPELNKAIYLDADVILKKDIKKLFETNLEGFPLAAVPEDFLFTGNQFQEKTYPEYKGGNSYFNSGVLLLDCDWFRKHNITQILIDKTLKMKHILHFPDQDILNIVFENNFQTLDYRFNFFPCFFEDMKKHDADAAEKAKTDAVIVHYTGKKPWRDKTPDDTFFWETAQKTVFYRKLMRQFTRRQYKEQVKNNPQGFFQKTLHKLNQYIYQLKQQIKTNPKGILQKIVHAVYVRSKK